jgi:uncharacterized membrane protein
MNITKLILLLSTIFILSACGEQEIYSVEYYVEHEQETNEKLKECKINLTFKTDQNCKNALRAGRKATIGTNNKDYTGAFD